MKKDKCCYYSLFHSFSLCLCISVVHILLSTSLAAMAQQLPTIALASPLSGFNQPVQVTHAGDGSGRLFVVEQGGRIRIVKNGAILSTPFLNISSRVSCCGERGLLGLAFPPSYSTKGYFYINYTNTAGNTVVARYRITTNADVADPNSEQIILTVNQPYANHNGGQLAFSPRDGYLYIGMGDGGSGGDPQNRAQNPAELLGKILRIDVETGSPATYTIPPSNPYANTPGYRREIWALGMRNPWRFSFDRQTNDLYIADVGQDTYEEIDYQPAASTGGENYGWRIMEGNHCFNPNPCSATGLTPPVVEYDHTLGCSVTGGFVYRGPNYPRMQGIYFYGDYCSGRLWGLRRAGGVWQSSLLTKTSLLISSFGEDEQGNLYVVDYQGGSIYMLTDTSPPLTYNISGRVANASGVGISGVTITLSGSQSGTTQTDSNGNYSFTFLPAGGNFTLTPSKQGYTFDFPSQTFQNLQSNQTANFVASAQTIIQFEHPGIYAVEEFSGSYSINVERTGDTSGTSTVDYATIDPTDLVRCDLRSNVAYPRCDYSTVADTLRFGPGETRKSIAIPLIDDAHMEDTETLLVGLSNPTGAALGASSTATLQIVDNDRAPGPNPILDARFFVRMQYLDFLSREPETNGFNAWVAVLNRCTNNTPDCDRIEVSASFFRSQEFQFKGYFVYLFYKVSLNRRPRYDEIIPDMSRVTGQTGEEVIAKKRAFTDAWVQRQDFRNTYSTLTNAAYVDALLRPYGVTSITTTDPVNPDGASMVTLTRNDLVNSLDAQPPRLTRAQVLRAVVQSREVDRAEYNGAFVAMQYYGYLRRAPEPDGYNAWLQVINRNPQDYRTMVNGFVNSDEYQLRFGQPRR